MESIVPQMANPTLDSLLPDRPRDAHHASILRRPSSQWLAQSPWVFRCSWLAVVSMHAVIAFAFYAMARLHMYIRAYSNVLMAMDYLGNSLVDYFPSVVAISAFNAAIHALAVGYVLFWSARYRTLLFSRPKLRVTSASSASLSHQRPWYQCLWARLFSCCHLRTKPSSEPSAATSEPNKPRHFEVLGLQTHDLELLVDIGLQTFQAHKMSGLIARAWINRLMTFVVVLHCWFVPFMHLLLRRQHHATVEIVRLVLDSILDLVYSLLVPSAIFYPYYRDFDVDSQSFNFINYYMDAWYINAVAENRQFFVTSWLDFVAKMLPGPSLFLRLHQIKEILMRQLQFGIKKIVPNETIDTSVNAGTRSLVTFQAQPTKEKRKVVAKLLYNALLLGWGLAVLVLHLHATSIAYLESDPGCLLELKPWMATKYVCVVLEVSCTQRGFTGDQRGIQEIFTDVDLIRVEGLIFSHCPELEVPSELQRIAKLQMLKVHNCTIAAWGPEAALTGASHPEIQLLYISLTNMSSGIPDGLLSDNFPATLYDIELCGTNLNSLPDDLHTKWPHVQYLSLELSPGITQMPPTLAHMTKCDWLSLSGNGITDIPDEFFANFGFYQLFLHSNPLQRLPVTLGDLSGVNMIGITNTNVSQLPTTWLNLALDANQIEVSASASPLCDPWLDSQLLSLGSSERDFRLGSFIVDCNAGAVRTHMFPLEWEQFWREQNR